MMQPLSILILEDDTLFAESLEDFLEEEGFAITLAKNGDIALEKAYEMCFDLLLLDINVPELSGIEVLKTLREKQQNTPAIFLTSFRNKSHIAEGFLSGGDDYLTKPVDLDELLLRIQALLRRAHKLTHTIMIGTSEYHPQEGVIYHDSTSYPLSKKVKLLLDLLIAEQNSIVSTQRIYESLWNWDETPSDASLRVYISELKKILGKQQIQNHKGLGYKLER